MAFRSQDYEQYIDKNVVATKTRKANEDCLSNFINAECVRRNAPAAEVVEAEELVRTVTHNIDEVLEMKSKARLRWLKHAVEGIKEERVKINPIFDIIKNDRFVDGLSGPEGRRALYTWKSIMNLLSWRQQKFVDSTAFKLGRLHTIVDLEDSDDDKVIEITDDANEERRMRLVATDREMQKSEAHVTEMDDRRRKRQQVQETRKRDQKKEEEERIAKLPKLYQEMRMDSADGEYYTRDQFIEEYGESGGIEKWGQAFAPGRANVFNPLAK